MLHVGASDFPSGIQTVEVVHPSVSLDLRWLQNII